MVARIVTLVIAIVVAVAGAGLVFLYVQQADERAIADAEGTDVFVVTRPEGVEAGTRIDTLLSNGWVGTKKVPVDAQIVGALPRGYDFNVLAGQVVARDLRLNDQLNVDVFAQTAAVADPFVIDEGTYLQSIELAPIDRLQGQITEGSRVALFRRTDATPEAPACNLLLLDEVRVVTSADLPQDVDPATQLPRALTPGTVTLEVTLDEVMLIRTAQQTGGTFSLLSLGDGEAPPVTGECLTFDEALEDVRAAEVERERQAAEAAAAADQASASPSVPPASVGAEGATP